MRSRRLCFSGGVLPEDQLCSFKYGAFAAIKEVKPKLLSSEYVKYVILK